MSTPASRIVADMREQVALLMSHDAAVRRTADAAELHEMRKAVRRLRAMLRIARAIRPADWVHTCRRELDWLGRSLGSVRDLDVLDMHVVEDLTDLGALNSRPAWRLRQSIAAVRRRRRAALLTALGSLRYSRLMTRLGTGLQGDDDQPVPLGHLVGRAFKKARKAGRRLPDEPADVQLHTIRILVKRARIGTEMVHPRTPRTKAFAKSAEHLQDLLGRHQDAVVARSLLESLVRENETRSMLSLRAQLLFLQDSRRKRARRRFPDSWALFERCGKKAWG